VFMLMSQGIVGVIKVANFHKYPKECLKTVLTGACVWCLMPFL
jgi:hypothetical protein